ncbi:MAG: AAA family ATPase [Betaproteobacteria bacterium]|nr:AAA family ATPase [Betaproteobacteria bacterium]MBK9674747.1 AAA family ATPase [Betaproteobacteria bacterium]
MYEAFYGLTDKPFQLNPDPSFYFGSRQHRRAMAYLEYGLHQNEGFIVVTGEVGAGKTTIVRSLLAKLDPHKVVAAQLVSTQLDAEDTLRLVAAAFGLKTKDVAKSDLLLGLEAFLVSVTTQGKRALLIVDEAQNLTPRAVEELRMLSNFQLETHALLQSFLVGQPEFRRTMQSPHMLQLRQRVIAACHIGPLDAEETRGYIEHRLKHVGWRDKPQFQPEVFPAVHLFTGGIPRRINALCDRLLLSGFIGSKTTFSRTDVDEVAREIREESFAGPAGGESEGVPATESAPGRAAVPEPQPVPSAQEILASIVPARASTQPGFSVDASRVHMEPEAAAEASRIIANMQTSNVEERLARLERQAGATLKLLRQVVDAVRVRPTPKADQS